MRRRRGVRHDLRANCPGCGATGFVDVATPDGELSPGEIWVVSCQLCGGSGEVSEMVEAAYKAEMEGVAG